MLRTHDDAGERNLERAEEATGVRPLGCPWRSLDDPFVSEVIRAHRWWKTSQLDARYGGEIPPDIMLGVETFDAALEAVRATDARLDSEEREEANRTRANAPPSTPAGRMTPPRRKATKPPR